MKHLTTHKENLDSLKRIEGQIKGVQRMVEDEKYCIDIVNQIHAAVNALYRISEKVLAKHIEQCISNVFKRRSEKDKLQKINELMAIIKRLHKLH